jgi:hypothetical protein
MYQVIVVNKMAYFVDVFGARLGAEAAFIHQIFVEILNQRAVSIYNFHRKTSVHYLKTSRTDIA